MPKITEIWFQRGQTAAGGATEYDWPAIRQAYEVLLDLYGSQRSVASYRAFIEGWRDRMKENAVDEFRQAWHEAMTGQTRPWGDFLKELEAENDANYPA